MTHDILCNSEEVKSFIRKAGGGEKLDYFFCYSPMSLSAALEDDKNPSDYVRQLYAVWRAVRYAVEAGVIHAFQTREKDDLEGVCVVRYSIVKKGNINEQQSRKAIKNIRAIAPIQHDVLRRRFGNVRKVGSGKGH